MTGLFSIMVSVYKAALLDVMEYAPDLLLALWPEIMPIGFLWQVWVKATIFKGV